MECTRCILFAYRRRAPVRDGRGNGRLALGDALGRAGQLALVTQVRYQLTSRGRPPGNWSYILHTSFKLAFIVEHTCRLQALESPCARRARSATPMATTAARGVSRFREPRCLGARPTRIVGASVCVYLPGGSVSQMATCTITWDGRHKRPSSAMRCRFVRWWHEKRFSGTIIISYRTRSMYDSQILGRARLEQQVFIAARPATPPGFVCVRLATGQCHHVVPSSRPSLFGFGLQPRQVL